MFPQEKLLVSLTPHTLSQKLTFLPATLFWFSSVRYPLLTYKILRKDPILTTHILFMLLTYLLTYLLTNQLHGAESFLGS